LNRGVIGDAAIKLRFEALAPVLDERGRRRFAAAEALAAGHGGVTAVARITGMARSTIDRGLAELHGEGSPVTADRVRREGGGRRSLVSTDVTLLTDLKALVEPATRGDPITPLVVHGQEPAQSCGGLQGLAIASATMSSRICCAICYSLQANRKTREGRAAGCPPNSG
jgi:hypothetical protein